MSNFEYKIISQVKEHLANVAKNPHAPLVIAIPGATPDSKVEVEFKPLAVEVKEASFRLYRKDNRDEVIVAHGVPAYRLGLVETGSLGGSTAVESTRIYRDSVIRPRKKALASVLNVHLLWKETCLNAPSVEFYFEDLDLAEEDHEKDVAEFMFKNGAATPNQLIAAFGSTFGWKAPEDAAALDSYYINGVPVYTPNVTEKAGSVSALNGAQVSSLLEVLAAVSAGTLAPDAAAAVIERAFLIPADVARRMIGTPTGPPSAPASAGGVEEMVEAVKSLHAKMVELVIKGK